MSRIKSVPVDEALDAILVEMAKACVAGNLRATANAVRKAHARLFAAVKHGAAPRSGKRKRP